MKTLKDISIRGRMAYLICLFENLLLYYNCNKEEGHLLFSKNYSVFRLTVMILAEGGLFM